MSNRRVIPWRPILLGLSLVALSTWGLHLAPHTRLVGSARVYAGTILPARFAGASTTWDMDLRLDPSIRPPGPAWSLHEGRRPGEGYQLRWLPDRGILQVHRSLPVPALLGSVRFNRPPTKISFRRRGGEVSVFVDGIVALRCLDPMPQAMPSEEVTDHFWGCQCTTGGDLGESILTVQTSPLAGPRWGSDGNPGTDDEERLRTRSDHTLLRVRAALAAVTANDPDAPRWLGLANAALGVARDDLAPLRGLPPRYPDIAGVPESVRSRGTSGDDRMRLTQWLALARIQWWLIQEDAENRNLDLARLAIQDLMELGQRSNSPEYPGMLLSLVPRLSAAASRVQARNEHPRDVADRRRRWLDLLAAVTDAAIATASTHLGHDDQYLLALVRQACAVLGGHGDRADALPLPLEAPPWMAVRWRLLAGDPPRSNDLPPLPEGSSGLAPAIDQLLGSAVDLPRYAAGAECLASLKRRETALAKGAEGRIAARLQEDQAARIIDDPRLTARDRAIGAALAALAIGPTRPALLLAARDALIPASVVRARSQDLATTPVLAEQDPLAWACLQLLLHRHPDLLPNDDTGKVYRNVRAPDEYANLLSGDASAYGWIWLVRLPPAEALAAALAAQELRVGRERDGALPDWSLLEEVPNLGLPLRLLKPREDQAPGALDTPP